MNFMKFYFDRKNSPQNSLENHRSTIFLFNSIDSLALLKIVSFMIFIFPSNFEDEHGEIKKELHTNRFKFSRQVRISHLVLIKNVIFLRKSYHEIIYSFIQTKILLIVFSLTVVELMNSLYLLF